MTKHRSPIESLVDAAVRCTRCGARMGQCGCWVKVKLRCPNCHRTQEVVKEDTDPVGTAVVEVACPDCQGPGDRPETHYYDAKGRWFDGEKFRRAST
jgi:DnaJ-class molecular chaperone